MIPRAIVITGATGGLGMALVSAYSAPGTALLLCGRDVPRLEAAASGARQNGAHVVTLTADLSAPAGRDTLTSAIAAFDLDHPIDLLIVSAGVKTGNTDGLEANVQTERIIAVNLTAAVQTVQAVLPGMQARRRGQIALIGSMAARSPHADLISYSATKSGIATYATALRRALRGSGVTISLVVPGFIDTPMTDRHIGSTPFLISPESAARRIRNGLARDRTTIAFPFRLVALVALSNALPRQLSDWIDSGFRAKTLPDRDEAGDG